ncbi:uncharacterized protein LOC111909936 [Lactuca sativa]|uniref:uncharacterized protein LOC111909936 n=1 Tax=Lactuca sativa TaxID=4236 RepID=UPI000CD8FC14|nr:uncharacterized protein LOC111909936 [Lactuca sativa]
MSSSFSKHFARLQIPLKDIASATNNFSDTNLIGENALRKTYKGKLSRSKQQIDIVAKRLLGKDEYKKAILQAEISTLSSLKHENLVSVVGFCDEKDEKIIIYKHEANGSLEKHLKDPCLTWIQRLEICVGVARALSYIHYDKERNFSLIHCNITSSKVLLDVNWNTKLSDFEFAKIVTAARRNRLKFANFNGTKGYIDPSYIKTGFVSHKTDVYSFGVVLFEVLCGRRAYVPWQQDWQEDINVGKLEEIVEEDRGSSQCTAESPSLAKHHSIVTKQDAVEAGSVQDTSDNFPMQMLSLEDLDWRRGRSQMGISFGEMVHFRPDSSDFVGISLVGHKFKKFYPFESQEKELLAPLAISHYENGKLEDMINPDLWRQIEKDSLEIFSETAYSCLKQERAERPHIDQIIIRLEKALDLQRKHENSLRVIKAKSEVDADVEGPSTTKFKWKGMEHLMIGYNDIEVATQKFTENRIGYGAFGDVYKAELEHFDSEKYSSAVEEKDLSSLPKICSTVAVKRLFKRTGTQADTSFAAEIKTLTSCKHPNIVSLLGFCEEDSNKMLLVYEYVPKGSLDDNLRSKDNMINLKWAMRLQICLDIAEGVNYLHTQKRIIHRDIKSANILLDHKWRAKIADFGLSKIIPESQKASYLHTKVSGTPTYLDPEYKNTKILKAASDIYSLGVVLFEIVSGTLAYDTRYTKENPMGIAHFARQHFNKGTLTSMLDPILKEEIDENNFTLSKGPNQGSLNTFLNIAHKCLAETQVDRPKIGYVISKIKDAMILQENHRDNLKISLEDIKLATNNFSDNNLIGRGGSARVYRGEVTRANRCHTVAAKRLNSDGGQHKNEFMTELEILQDYKHESVISLVGFCYEIVENIIVYEFASRGSLDMHLKDYALTWMKRLQISIDIASGLDFLHGSGGDRQEVVIHRDIKSSSILLTDDWKAKICDFGLSLISPINSEMDFVTDNACGAINYRDPVYLKLGYLTAHSDIYSFGVVLIEILCGRLVHEDNSIQIADLTDLYKNHYENGTLDEILFGGIKEQAVPESLITFQNLAYECLYHEREKRPTTHDVLLRLKKALEFQEDYVIWKPKLPNDYEEIFKMSNSCDVYSTEKKKELYNMLRKGILLQHDKVLFSLGDNGERNEMISARKFSYKHRLSHKWQSIPESRFPKVAKMSDLSNLKIRLKIRPQLLARGVNYSVHLFFKFCGPRKSLAKGMYVNLKYKLGIETLHAYFATWREDGWMMIELCRFSNDKEDIDFEFLLESFSRCYCGSRAIYVEGIQFLAIDNVKDEEIDELKNVPKVLKSDLNMDQLQKLMPTNCEEIFNDGEKILLLVNGKKHLMLSAKAALLEYPNAMPFQMKPSTQSSFGEEIELLPQQVLCINCRIKSEWLSGDMEYVCYLVFKISEKCIGLHYPVKVHNLLHGNNKKPEILYFRCPRPWNLHDTTQAPKQRADGWMEVRVWKLNSKHRLENDHFHVKLKLIIYEGTMSGLILCGLEFRAV